MKKLNKKGFSLVELIIVIAVIAILAAVLIPTFSNMIKKANESAVLQAARSAYEEALARDLADGVCDGKENAYLLSTDVKEHDDSSIGGTSGKEQANVSAIKINEGATNYELFEYTDSTKGLKASFDGSAWQVGPAA